MDLAAHPVDPLIPSHANQDKEADGSVGISVNWACSKCAAAYVDDELLEIVKHEHGTAISVLMRLPLPEIHSRQSSPT